VRRGAKQRLERNVVAAHAHHQVVDLTYVVADELVLLVGSGVWGC
jgi:hypothetical protein